MKVALICTDGDYWGFGIRVLSSALRKAGHSPTMVFLAADESEYSVETLVETYAIAHSADLIGISCHSQGAQRAAQVAVRLRVSKKPLIWGGVHATLNPEVCAPWVDAVCRGEGEETIVEIADMIESGGNWKDARNLTYLKAGCLVMNPPRPPLADLDALPPFDFERDAEFHLSGGRLAGAPQKASEIPPSQVLFIGSRGCAFHCTYCCNRKLKELYADSGKYLRRMSVGKYVDHLETLYARHFPSATDFFLMDEDFLLRSAEELEEFAVLYRRRVGIPFEIMASPTTVKDAKLRPLVEAGLWRLRMGVESGSERTKREIYDRRISNRVVLEAAETVRKHRTVVPCYFFIIGNPYEEEADLVDTIRFLCHLPQPYYAHMYNLVFFPGSALYERAIRDRIITGPEESGTELHFRRGFKYKKHVWKHKNLYLNALVFLAEGKATRTRVGLLPRLAIPWLIHPRTIRVLGPRTRLSEALIAGKMKSLALRAKAGAILKRVIGEPTAVYDLRRYFENASKTLLLKWSRWARGMAVPRRN